MTKILAIVGPTASGKSALSLELARHLGGEIISCDSMQVYRRMDIGTAKPTKEEQAAVRHHLIDIADPCESFSSADYVGLASAAIEDCASRGALPIICGGTGLYLDALLRGSDPTPDTVDMTVRRELAEYAERNGAEALWEMLFEIDPESARATHPNNVKRVARAIEVYRVSGLAKTELDRRSREGGSRYESCVIGLRYTDREYLYERIERRVDMMLSEGLVAETEGLMKEGVFEKNATAAQAIGYKEILPYCLGQVSLEEAAETLKTATRRYAKRQITWFGAKPYVKWIDIDRNDKKTFEEIVNIAKKLFKNS